MICSLQDLTLQVLEGVEETSTLKRKFASLFQKHYSEGSQLSKAYLALIAHLLQMEQMPVIPEQFPNGVALLENLGSFLKAPDPTHLAQLGVLWMVLGYLLKDELLQRAGLKVAAWHVHLLDHQGRVHLSLWSCAELFSPTELSSWSYALFTLAHRLSRQDGLLQLAELFRGKQAPFPMKLLLLVPENMAASLHQNLSPFAEEITVGMIKFSTPEASFMAHLSGWKSGLFSFHKSEVALVNAGPQVGPYDALDQFGISRTWSMKERPFKEMLWEKTAYHCRLKGWTQLAASPLWLELDAQLQAGQMNLNMSFQEKAIDDALHILLFLKCPKLTFEGKRILTSGSLEQYSGKAVSLELQGATEKMVLTPDAPSMHVIPLSGGDHFWGADFLVAFPVAPDLQSFSLSIK